jgi:hypothetical protein
MTTATRDAPVQAPDRSLQQRRAALRKANDIRVARAALKRKLNHTRRPDALREVAAHILQPDDTLLTMKVADLLMACPSVGAYRVHQVLTRGRISPNKTIGGLADAQRKWLAFALSQIAGRRTIGLR